MRALGFVSFLPVYRKFRDGLFYESLLPRPGPIDLDAAGGLAAAAAALFVLGWLIVRGACDSARLFFGVSSVLIGTLAIVFAGKAIAQLQEAGSCPLTR